MVFCNKDRLIADDTKQFELRRERFDGENLTPHELELAEELETEQVNICTLYYIDHYTMFHYILMYFPLTVISNVTK